MMQAKHIPLFFILCISLLHTKFHAQTDTITSSLSLRDPDSIISGGNVFRLGFFSPENSTNRYLAISYIVSEITTIWLANRNNPLTDNSGTLTISGDGNLVLVDGRNQTIWSTDAATSAPANTTAQLQDTGNLILRDTSTGVTVWNSFSRPTTTFMPGMNLYENTSLSSWRSPSDPGIGNFTSEIRSDDVRDCERKKEHTLLQPRMVFEPLRMRKPLKFEAWKLWNEGNVMVFSDQTIANSSFEAEILRCIQIALLCVQEFPKDRPTVQTVLSMLNSEIVELPLPEQPVFAEKWNHSHAGSSQPATQTGCSINELTITVLDGR